MGTRERDAGAVVPSADGVRPVPQPFRWLKRLGLAAILFVLVLVGVRLWWGWEAERRLKAAIDSYRAAGQPVLPEDFVSAPIPDEDNAAELLTQAHNKMVPSSDPYFIPRDRQAYLDRAAALEEVVAANREALGLIRRARSKPKADWKTALVSPVVVNTFPIPSLSSQRSLARLTCVVACCEHFRGDDRAAVERLPDMLAIGRHTSAVLPCAITYLTRNAIDALTVQVIEDIAPQLRVADHSGAQEPTGGPASRAQVEALIAELLEDEEAQRAWEAAMHGERMITLDAVRCVLDFRLGVGALSVGAPAEPRLPERAVLMLLGPAIKLDAVRAMDFYTAYGRAGAAPNWPAAQALAPARPGAASAAQQASRFVSYWLSPVESFLQTHYRTLAMRRMAAAALAIRLYEIDHGRRPSSLDQLVPDYLPAVPRDPFDAGDRPIGYAPDAERPVLYSVGINGIDEGGSFGLTAGGAVHWQTKDIPFFLNADRPRATSQPAAAPTSTQAVPDDQQVEGD